MLETNTSPRWAAERLLTWASNDRTQDALASRMLYPDAVAVVLTRRSPALDRSVEYSASLRSRPWRKSIIVRSRKLTSGDSLSGGLITSTSRTDAPSFMASRQFFRILVAA